jgi:hypothetical protein
VNDGSAGHAPRKKRAKRAKPLVVVAPLSITDDDQDAMPKTGMSGRRLREFVRAHGVGHHMEGRRMVVDAGDYVAKLRELASGKGEPSVQRRDEAELSTPESVLEAAGLRLVGGTAR